MKIIKIASVLFPEKYKKYTDFVSSYGYVQIDNENNVKLFLDARYNAAANEAGINFDSINNLTRSDVELDPFEWSIAEFSRFKFQNYKFTFDYNLEDLFSLDYQKVKKLSDFLKKYNKTSGKKHYYLVSNFMHMKKPVNFLVIDENGDYFSGLKENILFDPVITPLAYIDNLNAENAVLDPLREQDAVLEDYQKYKLFLEKDTVAWLKFAKKIEENYENMTELDAANYLVKMKKKVFGFEYKDAFEAIVGMNANAAKIHGRASEKQLENGVLLVDAGSCVNCFNSDTTRVFLLGNNALLEHKTAYTKTLIAHIEVVTTIISKTACVSELDKIARNYVNFDHALGHGVGSSCVHAFPTISSASDHKLLPDMLLAIEPGIYYENKFGIRLESVVRVKDYDSENFMFEYLTYFPFEYDLIDFDILSEKHKQWLSNFHKICYKKLVDNKLLELNEVEFLKSKVCKFINI